MHCLFHLNFFRTTKNIVLKHEKTEETAFSWKLSDVLEATPLVKSEPQSVRIESERINLASTDSTEAVVPSSNSAPFRRKRVTAAVNIPKRAPIVKSDPPIVKSEPPIVKSDPSVADENRLTSTVVSKQSGIPEIGNNVATHHVHDEGRQYRFASRCYNLQCDPTYIFFHK